MDSSHQHPFFEGAGDALAAGDKLFAGYGFRTERQFYEQTPYLNQANLVYWGIGRPLFLSFRYLFLPSQRSLSDLVSRCI